MTTGDDARGFSLRRWSQRKLAAARATGTASAMPASTGLASTTGAPLAPVSGTSGPVTGTSASLPGASAPVPGTSAPVPGASASAPPDVSRNRTNVTAPAATLPPVESLTPQSDFTAFLQPDVEEGLKRAALKQLFRDPRFNVMDRLDVYIDDYSKPDPIPPEILRQLVQGRSIFNPPVMRVNAQGFAEEVPPEEIAPERSPPDTVQPALADAPAPVDPPVPADRDKS